MHIQVDLRTLSAWCERRDMTWSIAHPTGEGAPAMLLTPRDPRRPWQTMLLVMEEPEMRLEDEFGETVACASVLPALLDAVDGGIAEPQHPRLLAHAAAGLTAELELVV